MKQILILGVIVLSYLSMLNIQVFATSDFSSPIIKKTYEQVNNRINAASKSLLLDENARSYVEQKKVYLREILITIDQAIIAKNKTTLQTQVGLFRLKFKETIKSIQSGEYRNTLQNTDTNTLSNQEG
jgi:hypothetical protein